MYIGQGVSLEARYAAQAERRAANTTMAHQASASAATPAERASLASPTFLSPTAEMDSFASPPPAGASSGASIPDDLTGSLSPLVYAKDFYIEQNRSLRALVVLCLGLMNDDGTPAIDLSTAPWSMMKKSVLKVSSKEYQSEITRRWNIMRVTDPDLKANGRWGIPRPNQWKLEKLQMWLNDNPVTDDGERAYLLDAVNERIRASTRAEAEKAVVSALFNKKWVGKEPILRLIHALVDNDEIKHAYLERFDVPSDRMVIENRNTSETRAACCWAMMAVKWNDPHFSPSSILMSELHSDFGEPIVIDHDVISDMTVATAEKVKEKWSGLLHCLKRQIEKWERSGQGDGGYIDNDAFGDDEDETRPAPKFGELSNRSQGALDSCAAFFRDKESYLLYLWEVLEWNGLLVSSMQRLNELAAARNGADGIPSVVGAAKRGDDSSVTTADGGNSQKMKDLSTTIIDHGKKMISVAKMKCNEREKDRNEREKDRSYAMQAEIRASLRSLGAEKRQMMIQMQAEKVKKNKTMETVYGDTIADIEEKEKQEIALLNDCTTTPQKSNLSPV